MKFTVFGGRGFVGRNVVSFLQARGYTVDVPERDADVLAGTHLGHVIYAIGLTGDFRSRPFDTIESHVHTLTRLMRPAQFDSWLYLSSTRVYGGLGVDVRASEITPVEVIPSADSLYDLSKLLGEAVCIGHEKSTVRVARLSNVYGPGLSKATFLGAVLEELARAGKVEIREDPLSSKDYVAISDVVRLLHDICVDGSQRIYNVASGTDTTHQEVAQRLIKHTGKVVTFAPDAPRRNFPSIDISRVRNEFGDLSNTLVDDIEELLKT